MINILATHSAPSYICFFIRKLRKIPTKNSKIQIIDRISVSTPCKKECVGQLFVYFNTSVAVSFAIAANDINLKWWCLVSNRSCSNISRTEYWKWYCSYETVSRVPMHRNNHAIFSHPKENSIVHTSSLVTSPINIFMADTYTQKQISKWLCRPCVFSFVFEFVVCVG